MEKRYEEKWGRRVARCIGGTSSRLRVLSGHGNRCQLFFSFSPLRRSVVLSRSPSFSPTFGLDSFGQRTHFSPFVESFLERLCGPDTTAIRATLNNTHSLRLLLNRRHLIDAVNVLLRRFGIDSGGRCERAG